MFRSFFPEPRVFFPSAIVWTILSFAIWNYFSSNISELISIGSVIGIAPTQDNPNPFFSAEKVFLYQYILLAGYLFCVPWYFIKRTKWFWWSVVGSVTILEIIYFNVQIGAWLNDWYGGFYNTIQRALTEPNSVTPKEFYGPIWTVAYVLVPNITVLVLNAFFTSHYLFRWRRAMNAYYLAHWPIMRKVEGASQRIQEDIQRFVRIVEGLATTFIGSLMTLIVFLPLLFSLSQNITELPFFGAVNGSLVWVALVSAAFGTVLLALVGIKLPGLEFENQKVEAALRKELVYGEDKEHRAQPLTIQELFSGVQRNYYRIYLHYLYFNIARYAYLQIANFVPLVAMGPSILTGALTLGLFQQINNAFSQVEDSFKFLASSWTSIIDLLSVFKRLRLFEKSVPKDAEMAYDMDDPVFLNSGSSSP